MMISYETNNIAPSNIDGIKHKRSEKSGVFDNTNTEYYRENWDKINQENYNIWRISDDKENEVANNGLSNQKDNNNVNDNNIVNNVNTNNSVSKSNDNVDNTNDNAIKSFKMDNSIDNLNNKTNKNINTSSEKATGNYININNNNNNNNNDNNNNNSHSNNNNNSAEDLKTTTNTIGNSNGIANLDNQITDSNIKNVDGGNDNNNNNSTNSVSYFPAILIAFACVLAVAIFVGVKVKGYKKKMNDEEKQKEIMEQHARAYENSYPMKDFLSISVSSSDEEEFGKDPSEFCQDLINELNDAKYNKPVIKASQKPGFFPSQKLASSLCYASSSSNVLPPEQLLVDSKFEKKPEECVRIQPISNIRFTLTQMGMSHARKESSNFVVSPNSLPYTGISVSEEK